MSEDEVGPGVAVRVDRLVVELENVFALVERAGAVRVHDEVNERLVGEEGRLVLEGFVTFDA
mgnify:CR=1 FL=1